MAREAPLVATYSIAACDLDAGQWGVATQSKFLAVGSVVPWAEPGVGAVATQAYANPRYGPEGLALLRDGVSAEEVVDQLTAADDGRDHRQLGDRRRARRRRDVHRQCVHGLGRRARGAGLRRPGEHPRRRRDRVGPRIGIRRDGGPAARRAAARMPRVRTGCRWRPARPAVGGAARGRARRRLRTAERRPGRPQGRRRRTAGHRAGPAVRPPFAALRQDARRAVGRGRRRAAGGAHRPPGSRSATRASSSEALAEWSGTENLEERVDGVERIDPVVLAELRAR